MRGKMSIRFWTSFWDTLIVFGLGTVEISEEAFKFEEQRVAGFYDFIRGDCAA